MHKLYIACLAVMACTVTATTLACPLTDGVHPDTSCVREALDKTIEAAGLQKVPPLNVEEMRWAILNRPPLQKAYAENLHACLARTHDCEGPGVQIASPIDDVGTMSGVPNVSYCGIQIPKGNKWLKPGPVYCPSGLQCRKLDPGKYGVMFNCVAPGHHVCRGHSINISCPNGWECVDDGLTQTCRKSS